MFIENCKILGWLKLRAGELHYAVKFQNKITSNNSLTKYKITNEKLIYKK